MYVLKKYIGVYIIFYVALSVIYFVIKDHYYYTAVIFYALSMPVLLVLYIPILLAYSPKKTPKYICRGIFTIGILFWGYHYRFYNSVSQPLTANHSVLFWNVADKKEKNSNVLQQAIEKTQPETVILVEAHVHPIKDTANFSKQFKPLHTKFLYGSMFAASKYPISYVKYLKVLKSYRLSHIKIAHPKQPLHIAVVDVFTNPLFDRKPTLERILNYVEANNIDVIVGDFNTPFESVHFKPFYKHFKPLRQTQNSFTATWPFGIPLLELDQIWIRKNYNGIALKKSYHKSSDHAMLQGYFH